VSKKLSPAQTRFLERLASGTDGCHMPPFGCPGATASGWYRTAQSLHDRGLVVFTGSQAFFPRKFAEREVERTKQALKEIQQRYNRSKRHAAVMANGALLRAAKQAHQAAQRNHTKALLAPLPRTGYLY
jgi:hypothetical protein